MINYNLKYLNNINYRNFIKMNKVVFRNLLAERYVKKKPFWKRFLSGVGKAAAVGAGVAGLGAAGVFGDRIKHGVRGAFGAATAPGVDLKDRFGEIPKGWSSAVGKVDMARIKEIEKMLASDDLDPGKVGQLQEELTKLRKLPGSEIGESFMKEQTDIKHLIKHVGEKNYFAADKYLKKVVEDKLQAKIKKQYNNQKLY